VHFFTFDHMFIRFVCLQLFWCILALLPNFEAKCARNGSKNLKTYLYMCLGIHFWNQHWVCLFIFLEKANLLFPSEHLCQDRSLLMFCMKELRQLKDKRQSCIITFACWNKQSKDNLQHVAFVRLY
jgi:hypothetical protein